jgi:putative NADH-flavin reductase
MTVLLIFLFYALFLSVALARKGCRSSGATSKWAPSQLPKRVLIIGATGGTGSQLVQQALERSYTVTALVRNPSKLQSNHPQLNVVQGNVLDEGDVSKAMTGQDAVLCALGHKQFFRPTLILSEGTQNILLAMEAQSVTRLVCETSLGIGDSAFRMGLYYTFFVIPVILPFYYWDKTRQERLIARSSVDWVIVRPGVLTDGDKRGHPRHGRHIGSFLWTVRISRADVAGFMLDQLAPDTYLRTAAGVCW